jgi:hypothetical protein
VESSAPRFQSKSTVSNNVFFPSIACNSYMKVQNKNIRYLYLY